jgi:hypothetical protein
MESHAADRLGASAEVRAAYERLLAAVGAAAGRIGDRPITPFFPQVGSSYRGTVIVGQATYGWLDTYQATVLAAEPRRTAAMEAAIEGYRDRAEQMDWLEAFPKTRSAAFWQTARYLSETLEPGAATPWYARIAWTNLYPVSWQPVPSRPQDRDFNPSGALREAQNDHVAGFLLATLRALGAKRVIIYGGSFWWPTSMTPPFDTLTEAARPLQAKGRLDGMAVVVGYHPNGAMRRGWGLRAYQQILLDALADAEGLR